MKIRRDNRGFTQPVAKQQAGFTILELLIATTVFSVLLMLATGVIVQLSRSFYKGLHLSRTQEVARTLGEELARNIQFSSTPPERQYPVATDANGDGVDDESDGFDDNGISVWCIADRRYMFVKSRQLGTQAGQSPVVALVSSTSCNEPFPMLVPGSGDKELVGEGMRLANLTITQGPSDKVWTISLRVLRAEDDLLCSPTFNDCNATQQSEDLTAPDLQCKLIRGSEFCASADYSMTVVRRL